MHGAMTDMVGSGNVKCCIDAHAELGEGPLWDEEEQVLYWVDISGEKLHRYDPASGDDRVFDVGQPVGTVVLRRSGGVMLAVRDGFATFDLDTRELTLVATPEAHMPNNRFNDGKCDPAGRFWAGTVSFTEDVGAGSLYCLDADYTCRSVLSGVTISNGLTWTADHRMMYYVDSIPGTVTAFDYDVATGDLRNSRIIISVDEAMGLPDGMAIDAEDKLWIAHHGGGCVRRWDPETATVLHTIHLPAPNVTACAFGRALQDLYITSASCERSEQDRRQASHGGGVFVTRPGVQGQATYRFAG